MPRIPLSDWTAEQFRCTAFVFPGVTLPASHWWARITGSDPENVSSNPRQGTTQADGGFGPGRLVVSAQPGRVEWFLVPDPAEKAYIQGPTSLTPLTPPSPSAPSLGGATETFEFFTDISRRWLAIEDIPDLSRLALGGVFSHPEEDKTAAYLRLPEYVPVRVSPESTDFLYQINLPMHSRLEIPGLQINRLSKWSVSAYKLIALQLLPNNLQDLATTIALRSEVDINTSQEFEGALPRGRLVDIVNELNEIGRHLITNGVA